MVRGWYCGMVLYAKLFSGRCPLCHRSRIIYGNINWYYNNICSITLKDIKRQSPDQIVTGSDKGYSGRYDGGTIHCRRGWRTCDYERQSMGHPKIPTRRQLDQGWDAQGDACSNQNIKERCVTSKRHGLGSRPRSAPRSWTS